jgi:hypothetical protein
VSPSRRVVAASLVALVLLSVGVVAEAERNYATVTELDASTASVTGAEFDDGVTVTLEIHNSMNRPVRVEYVNVDLRHDGGSGGASTPYNGYRSLDPGTGSLTAHVPARLTGGELSPGKTVEVSGTVTVRVYNGYEFDIPIEPREVTL